MTKGMDYDVEVFYPDGLAVPADAKCKFETTKINPRSVLNSLVKARKQLPDNRPCIIFMKVPQSWIEDVAVAVAMEGIGRELMRNTDRIVSIKFYVSLLEARNNMLIHRHAFREITNEASRFHEGRNWDLFKENSALPSLERHAAKMAADYYSSRTVRIPDFDILGEMRRRAFAALVPPAQVPLSEWIEAQIVLPEGLMRRPGPMRLYPLPTGDCRRHWRPGNRAGDHAEGGSDRFCALLAAAIGSYCINDPSPILAVQPTQDDCRDFVVSDLEPMFKASPALAGIFGDEARTGQRGKTRNTVLSRQFPGGSLKIVPSKSPRNLRRHTARILCDRRGGRDAGRAGRLADRTRHQAHAHVFGPQDNLRQHANRRRDVERLRGLRSERHASFRGSVSGLRSLRGNHLEAIEWPAGEPETAAYRCEACNALIEEEHKPAMVEAGRWRATGQRSRPCWVPAQCACEPVA